MDEFALIQRYFDRAGPPGRGVNLGIGDDAALVRVPDGFELAVTTDTMVESVHFPADAPPHAIGYRALATNLSDLAAMGATPAWATLALTLARADESWLAAFSQGFFELAEQFDVALIGGDVTRGPLTITVGLQGTVPAGGALRRDGAQAGDLVFVTGALGAGAAGLKAYPERRAHGRYLYPRPRVAEGVALRDWASAGIDISDGLLADLGHIVEASGTGADIRLDQVPVAAGADVNMALTGGDDYELCFTINPARAQSLRAIWRDEWAALAEIGVVRSGSGVRCVDAEGASQRIESDGYRHF
jgi:thiamine-monophosphate kinase